MVKIFVGRLPEDVKKNEIEDLFKEHGDVTDCSILKNYGFVHMAELSEAKNAIKALDKSNLKGNTINVELSTTKVSKTIKLFIGNVAEGTKSDTLHKLFKKYGTVLECDVVKNFAFVHMARENNARDAIQALNNYELNGKKIAVQMSRNKPEFDRPGLGPPFHGDFRGRGRGGFRGGPMRGGFGPGMRGGMPPPRFPRDPYLEEPYFEPQMFPRPRPMRGSRMAHLGRNAPLGSMYDHLSHNTMTSRRQALMGGGSSLLMREREALSRQLEAEALAASDPYAALGAQYDFAADQLDVESEIAMNRYAGAGLRYGSGGREGRAYTSAERLALLDPYPQF